MNKPIPEFTSLIAIDPGASGGIAFQHADQPVTAYSMPPTEGDVLHLIRELTPQPSRCIAFVESVSGFVGKAQPGSRAFTFGRGFGFLLGLLQERGVRLELVLPRRWQTHFNLGTASACASPGVWKRKLKAEAQRRFPAVKVTLGTADALLLLDYGFASLKLPPTA